MLNNFKDKFKGMYSRTLGRMSDREKMTIFGSTMAAGLTASVIGMINISADASKAVELSLGDRNIAKQIYLEATKNNTFQVTNEVLAEIGVRFFGGNIEGANSMAEVYINLHADNHFEKVSYKNLNAQNIDNFIEKAYADSKNLYENNNEYVLAAAKIDEKLVKNAYKRNINDALKLGIAMKDNIEQKNETELEKNIKIAKEKHPDFLSFNDFTKKITSDNSSEEALELYKSYVKLKVNQPATDVKVDKENNYEQNKGINR